MLELQLKFAKILNRGLYFKNNLKNIPDVLF